ncbi:MAG: DUF4344 domain-containing metallopeptidase [Pseudoruegeria sp.]
MFKLRTIFLTTCLGTLPMAGMAGDDEDQFVDSNLLGIFYHELGHAVIDLMQLPVFGQEEDAADVFSILLVNEFFDEETATALAYDAALGFLGEAAAVANDEPAYWDVHGLDEQRFYNLVCLFYGANPNEREDFAEAFELPEYRGDSCPEEFDLAYDSWSAVLDEMGKNGGGQTIGYRSPESDNEVAGFVHDIIAPEVSALNEQLQFPQSLEVRIEECGEANAFYDPESISITICEEFVPHLQEMAVY